MTMHKDADTENRTEDGLGDFKRSFAPIEGPEVRLLILGSMPGDASLRAKQYYAHPQNRFWPLMAGLLSCGLPTGYAAKEALLIDHKIALWDVAMLARRPGSMDSAMQEEVPNAIESLLERHPELRMVAFNGKKAEQLYNRFFERKPGLHYLYLPSTSPANASFGKERLLACWKAVLASLD